MNHSNLRLTPQNSPFFKSPTPRSPTKASKSEEPGLQLRKVIGTTTESAHGFDYLSRKRCFAYLAGAAAVVASVDADLNVTQRFFRARPNHAAVDEPYGQWPGSSSPLATRNRGLGYMREGSVGASPLGQSVRDTSDSPSGKSSSAKDRVKALTSVALSADGKWLAVGETGYKPRILLFSTAEGSAESPIAIIAEHTFGVHSLAFSPDSRYLASLGTVNDGFLHIWSIDSRSGSATLHASNKCTVTINAMEWLGRSVVTAGLRHVKVWRPDEMASAESGVSPDTTNGMLTPRHRQESRSSDFGSSVLSTRQKVLEGKNCLLGELLDANFVSMSTVNVSSAMLCTASGDVCWLDDSDGKQNITPVAAVGFAIFTASIDHYSRIHVKGLDGEGRLYTIDELTITPESKRSSRRRSSRSTATPIRNLSGTSVTALGFVDGVEVAINSHRAISLRRLPMDSQSIDGAGHVELAAHGEAAVGTQAMMSSIHPTVEILSFSSSGAILLWDLEGVCISKLHVPIEHADEMYGVVNQLRAVSPLSNGSLIAAADRYGTLSILEVDSGETVFKLRAHSAEVQDIATFDSPSISLIATAGRDRMVQLFAWRDSRLDLLQTMDEHAGAVSGVFFSSDGKQLLSCSPDRSIVVREAMLRNEDDPSSVAFMMLRALSLKSSPTSMCLADSSDAILVATTDRCIGRYSTKSGRLSNSFKCSDLDGGEAVVISKVLFSPSLNGSPTITAVSSSDKSVRLYTEYGSLMARDWGHTEGITDATLVPDKQAAEGHRLTASLVTVAADSTMFIWDTASSGSRSPSRVDPSSSFLEQSTASDQPTLSAPLRRVISHSELARTKREKSASVDVDTTSPPTSSSSAHPSSPHRLRKKTSRMSVAQPPRLEPAFRSNFADSTSSRRHSLRHRSPSPPSPRTIATKRETARRPSGLYKLRSKSSENVLSNSASDCTNGASSHATSGGFESGSKDTTNPNNLATSTTSLIRSLRGYRRRLALQQQQNKYTGDPELPSPDVLRELQEELKLTARAIGERTAPQRPRSQRSEQSDGAGPQNSNINSHVNSNGNKNGDDEEMMEKLLDRASEKIVGMLDGKIKERVENELGILRERAGEESPKARGQGQGAREKNDDGETLAGAVERVKLEA